MTSFKHYNLNLVVPSFDSEITDLIMELNHLRKRRVMGSTHPQIFFQLKKIFHILESIGSARIEGNHTTIAEYIEYKADGLNKEKEDILEIQNMEEALNFIEENIDNASINRIFMSEVHKIVVKNLNKKGSQTPGQYRRKNLKISGATHVPPDFLKISDYMEELFQFINKEDSPKYDLLKTAISHHRFVWIHPFDNGNGRTVRLLTYAMLIKQGFNVTAGGRLLNPTAVFCFDRNLYYEHLSEADSGTEEGILKWCDYVLRGLKEEIEKIDNLLDYSYVKSEILLPAIKFSEERKIITPIEEKILKRAVKLGVFQNSDLTDIFTGKKTAEISRQIRYLKEKGLIENECDSKRKYVISFSGNYLLRGVIKALKDKGFIPESEEI